MIKLPENFKIKQRCTWCKTWDAKLVKPLAGNYVVFEQKKQAWRVAFSCPDKKDMGPFGLYYGNGIVETPIKDFLYTTDEDGVMKTFICPNLPKSA